MDVVLHIGAHRCATTSFQHYMRHNAQALNRSGIAFWGPGRTRGGLFDGILPGTRALSWRGPEAAACQRIQARCAQLMRRGHRTLIVSDENMLGTMRANLRHRALYPDAGGRLARFAAAFGTSLRMIVVNIRPLDTYWASVLAHQAVRRGQVPGSRPVRQLAGTCRSWRDVLGDIAQAAPAATVLVLPFETFAGRPDAQLAQMSDRPAISRWHADIWRNASPDIAALRRISPNRVAGAADGAQRWMPFSPDQRALLQEAYADDLLWLRSGAEGRASLIDYPDYEKASIRRRGDGSTMERSDDGRAIAVARTG